MKWRISGVGGFGFNIQWESSPGDEEVARRALIFLEDRRLLFGQSNRFQGGRPSEDALHCVHSAIEIRQYLTEELGAARPGRSLEQALTAMRAAFRQFIDAAGPDGRNFYPGGRPFSTDPFSLALGELRAHVGRHVGIIAGIYELEVEEELAAIVPPDDDDPSWLPGFASDNE